MPVNFTVKAAVVDVRQDTPKAGDRFYVDTNAWFWTVYSRTQIAPDPPRQYQTDSYPAYLKKVLNMGAKLHWCGLSLSELARQIERVERKIYCRAKAVVLDDKEFRHNLPSERVRVVQEIDDAWKAVESLAGADGCVNFPELNTAFMTAALDDFKQLPMDAYDLFSVRAIRAANITQVISDDGDFCTVPGITLFTANPSAISAAQAQKKFRRR
jgi:hypothetical protein